MCIIHKNLVEPFDSLTIYEYNSNFKKKKRKLIKNVAAKFIYYIKKLLILRIHLYHFVDWAYQIPKLKNNSVSPKLCGKSQKVIYPYVKILCSASFLHC